MLNLEVLPWNAEFSISMIILQFPLFSFDTTVASDHVVGQCKCRHYLAVPNIGSIKQSTTLYSYKVTILVLS